MNTVDYIVQQFAAQGHANVRVELLTFEEAYAVTCEDGDVFTFDATSDDDDFTFYSERSDRTVSFPVIEGLT